MFIEKRCEEKSSPVRAAFVGPIATQCREKIPKLTSIVRFCGILAQMRKAFLTAPVPQKTRET